MTKSYHKLGGVFLLILMNSITIYSLISDLVNEVVLNRVSFIPKFFLRG